jgi:hypothetical protein
LKLTAQLDLSARRAAAADRINFFFSAQAAGMSSAPVLHAAKAAHARRVLDGEAPAPSLIEEASARGLAVNDLCASIVRRASLTEAFLLGLEGRRQQFLAAIEAATSQQDIDAALAALA